MVNIIARSNDYADLDLDFVPHPTTKDIYIRKGAQAVARSVRNLVLSNFYERPFQSYLGCGVQQLLFENATALTEQHLKDAIGEVIRNYEPRVRLDAIDITFDYDRNGYEATLRFTILNRDEPVVTGIFLERIR